ncbi:MAG: 23S rRNA (guanosine(2251)-2'-O)-methyltransferase RlmB [Holosporales bacterium]|nr:23S rRNA (guanosine(2251)-2'-O)-methyltransferase RlmB [Holosporales bacterium]
MLIYGIHACKSAVTLRKQDVLRVYVADNKPIPTWLSRIPKNKLSHVDEIELQRMLPKNATHQGVAIEIDSVQFRDVTELSSTPKNCVVAILDGVTDPHNLGSIIRSAAAFGVKGIILTERSSCKVTGVVAKTASGGLDRVSIYIVKNLAQTIDILKSYGFWIVAFSERGDKLTHELDLRGKTCIILGSEGSGIRRLQIENADFVTTLPTNPQFPTLNVSIAAAIGFYEVARQNGFGFED